MSDGCVFYLREEHAGFWKRMAVLLIDGVVVLIGAIIGLSLTVAALGSIGVIDAQQVQHASKSPAAAQKLVSQVLIAGCVIAVLYHLVLWRTRGGTVGFRLMGLRLTALGGGTPIFGQLIRRLLIALIFPAIVATILLRALAVPQQQATTQPVTPASFITGLVIFSFFLLIGISSYLSIPRSARRQAQHDRFSGTWVIRRDAVPGGAAQPVEAAVFLGTIRLPYWDVEPTAGLSTLEPARPLADQ